MRVTNILLRLLAIACAPIVVAACSEVVPGTAHNAPLHETTVVLMNPFTLGGPAPRIAIVGETTGNCHPSVVDYGNSNARRCFTNESKVLDPCFVSPTGSMGALCMQDPARNEAIKLTINDDLGLRSEGDTTADPWFVELENALHCGAMGGATSVLNGMRLAYSCGDGNYLYGSVDRSRLIWIIHHQREGSPVVNVVAIRTAWY